MCHIIRNVEGGSEMRSRFWLGHVSVRDANQEVASPANVIGNSWLNRWLQLDDALADSLSRHATEEMAFLAELLPQLYERETQD